MIDKMIRCKDLNSADHIESINEWFVKCPPAMKDKHWKDSRSAKETAKYWVYTIPQPFKDILKPFKLAYRICSPEYVTHFDAYSGNGRNHDLFIFAENETKEKVVISVESKVDESFDDTVSGVIKKADKRKKDNPNSKGLIRILELRECLFGFIDDSQLQLRYQLLIAVAGVIAEAKKQKAKTAILLVQTFISDEINTKKHEQNKADLNAFITQLTNDKYQTIENNKIVGPIRISKETDKISKEIDLWIGKYEIEI